MAVLTGGSLALDRADSGKLGMSWKPTRVYHRSAYMLSHRCKHHGNKFCHAILRQCCTGPRPCCDREVSSDGRYWVHWDCAKCGGWFRNRMWCAQSAAALGELKRAGCSAADLKAKGHTVVELRDDGYTAFELHQAGFSALEVNEVGFDAADLRGAGYTATDLKQAGRSISELKTGGYTELELRPAFSAMELRAARFDDLQMLKLAGYSAADLKEAGHSVLELKAAGYNAKDVRTAGFGIAELMQGGYTVQDLTKLACSASDLRAAGCGDAKALQLSGHTAKAVKEAGYCDSVAELKALGYNATDVRTAGFENAAEFKVAGFTMRELNPAFSAIELQSGGFESAKDLCIGGYNAISVVEAGYCNSAVELRAAGFCWQNVRWAGFKPEAMNVSVQTAFCVLSIPCLTSSTVEELAKAIAQQEGVHPEQVNLALGSGEVPQHMAQCLSSREAPRTPWHLPLDELPSESTWVMCIGPRPCPKCTGSGKLPESCKRCRGRGHYTDYCSNGQIDSDHNWCVGCPGSWTVKCSDCRGLGIFENAKWEASQRRDALQRTVVITCAVVGEFVTCTNMAGKEVASIRVLSQEEPFGQWLLPEVKRQVGATNMRLGYANLRLVTIDGEDLSGQNA